MYSNNHPHASMLMSVFLPHQLIQSTRNYSNHFALHHKSEAFNVNHLVVGLAVVNQGTMNTIMIMTKVTQLASNSFLGI